MDTPELQLQLPVKQTTFEPFLAPSKSHGKMAVGVFSQHRNLL